MAPQIPHEMTPETEVGEVWIGGYPFYCLSLQADKSNIYARKVNQGDPTEDDHPIFSTSAQRDWSGGWLVFDQNPASDTNRCWYSTCSTEHPGLLTLPFKTVEYNAPNGESGTPVMVGDFNGRFYACWGNNLYAYTPGTMTPTLVGDMGSRANGLGTTFVEQPSGGTGPGDKYLFIPVQGGYVTLDTGGNLLAGTSVQTVVTFEVWDQKIWRLGADGSLAWAIDLPEAEEDWTYDCSIPDGSTPLGMTSYINMERAPCLVVVSAAQVWKHDFVAHVLHAEDLWFPNSPHHGLATIKHRTALRVSAGTDIARYDNNTISFDDSLSSRNGLPNQYRGHIVSMASGFNDFYALVQGFTIQDASEEDTQTIELNVSNPNTFTMTPANSHNLLVKHNGNGWHYVWAGAGGTPTNVTTSNLPGYYNLFWGCGNHLYQQQLPTTYLNLDDPAAIKLPYARSCIHYSSWNDWGWGSQPKIMKMIESELKNMDHDGHRATFWYRVDDDDAPLVQLGEKTVDGEVRWFMGRSQEQPTLPNGRGHYKGLRHKRYQLVIALERGDDELQAPAVKRHTVVARKWLRPQRTWRLRLDLTRPIKDHPEANSARVIQELADAQEAVVFQHKDEQTMVELTLADWGEGTGRDRRANYMVVLTESFEQSLELEGA